MFEVFARKASLADLTFSGAAMEVSEEALIARLRKGLDQLEAKGLIPPHDPRDTFRAGEFKPELPPRRQMSAREILKHRI